MSQVELESNGKYQEQLQKQDDKQQQVDGSYNRNESKIKQNDYSNGNDHQQNQKQNKYGLKYLDSEERNDYVSLLNFDENSRFYPFLTSPRSKEACLRQGVEEHQLLRKTRKDFEKEQIPNEFKDDPEFYINLKAEKYEKRRQERLVQVQQERDNIIQELKRESQYQNRSFYKSQGGESQLSNLTSTQEQEKQKLQVLKKKQEQQIEFLLENQRKQQEIMEKQEQKELRVYEMERKKQLEFERKRIEAEEAERYRQSKKQEAEKIQQIKAEELLDRYQEADLKIRLKNEQLQRQREQEQIKREIDRRHKMESIQAKIQYLTAEKNDQIEQRKQEREIKLSKVEQQKQEEQVERMRKMREKEEEHKIKLEQQKIEEIRQKQIVKQKYNEKQYETEQKRLHDQQVQEQQLQNRVLVRMEKERIIKKQLSQNFKEDQANKKKVLQRFEEKQQQLEYQRLKRLEHIMERKKSQEQHQQEVLDRNRRSIQQINLENKTFLNELERKTMIVNENRQSNINQLRKRVALELLKIEEAKENQERVEKMRAYQKHKLLSKLQEDQIRIEMQQKEKEEQKRNRENFKKQLNEEKQRLVRHFALEMESLKNSKKESFMQSHSQTVKNLNQSNNYENSQSSSQFIHLKILKQNNQSHSQENLNKNYSSQETKQNKQNKYQQNLSSNNQLLNIQNQQHENDHHQQQLGIEQNENKPQVYLTQDHQQQQEQGQINENNQIINEENQKDIQNLNKTNNNKNQDQDLNKSLQSNKSPSPSRLHYLNASFSNPKVKAYGKDITKEKLKLLIEYEKQNSIEYSKTKKATKKKNQKIELHSGFSVLRQNQIDEINDNLNFWSSATENILKDFLNQQKDQQNTNEVVQLSEKLLNLYQSQISADKQQRKQINYLGLFK